MSPFFLRDRGPVAALLALCALLYLPGLGARDFWEPDEPEFALLARTMAERGDWVVPWQNGASYAEKPPLLYWATILATGGGRAFEGDAAWAPFLARLPSAAAATALVLGLYLFARRPHGRRAAFLAALVLATAGRFAWQARFLQTDMLFTAAAAGAVMLFLAADRAEGPRPAGGLLVAAWVLLALSVLAKGPLGPVLAAAALVPHLVLGGAARARRALGTPAHLAGLLLFAAVAVPWYLLVRDRLGPVEGPEFLRQNLVEQNLGRTADSYSHAQPPWYYLLTLPGDFGPWTPLLVVALAWTVRRCVREKHPDARLVMAWFLPAFLLLSFVSSKQGKYLLPLFPPLALAVGLWLDGPATRDPLRPATRWAVGIPGVLFVLLGIALLGARAFAGLLPLDRFPTGTLAWPGVVLLLGGAAATTRLLLLADPARAACDLAITVALALAAFGLRVAPALDPLKSARGFCEAVARLVPPDAALAQFGSYRSAYPFFLRRDTEVLRAGTTEAEDARREADPEARRAAKASATEALRAFLARPGRGFVITQVDYWSKGMTPEARALLEHRPLVRSRVGSKEMVLLAER